MTFTIELTASAALVGAINTLASALKGQGTQVVNATAPQQVVTEDTVSAGVDFKKHMEAKAATTAAASSVTIEQVRALVQAKAQAGKREEVKELLSEFGAKSVTTLDASAYADFMSKVEAL